jgi:hypothetical protein
LIQSQSRQVGLFAVGLALLVIWGIVSALTACLNESPRFAGVAQAAVPRAFDAAQWLLGRFRLVDSRGSCEPSSLAQLLGLAGLLYLAGLFILDGGRLPRRLALGLVLGVALACQLILFATPALLSTDILDYASYGRVAGLYGLNPYVATPETTLVGDPFWGYGAWQQTVTVYGPLWTSIDATLARLLPIGDPVQMVLAYKTLALVVQLANLGLVGWLVARWLPVEQQVAAFAVYAWNPLLLLELVGNGHNDALMVLCILLAMAVLTVAWRSGSAWGWGGALVCLELGALVKFVPLGVMAAVIVVWLRRLPTARERLRQGALVAVVLVAIAGLISWPWLSSSDVLQPLLGIASGGQRFKDGWQDALAAWIAVRILPPLGVPAEPAQVRESVSRSIAWGISRAIFLVYLLFEVAWLWRRSREAAAVAVNAIAQSAARALLLAVLLFVTQVYPWYFLWPLPLATLLGWRNPLTKAVVAFGLAFLPAYYLREFQSYGVFYLPLYVLAALVVLGVTWGSDHLPRRRAWRALSEAAS